MKNKYDTNIKKLGGEQMSAIFGVINLTGTIVAKSIELGMIDRFNKCKIDSIKVLNKKGILFGCGLQHITVESLTEILPYYDESSGITITADAIIDNRNELINLLIVPKNRVISDSQLILLAFKKWGKDCVKYLIGDFAFVIWDEKNNNLFCARDHIGKRTFYYYYKNNVFAFATLIKPIFEALNEKPDLNERWIADFLALPLTIHESEIHETLYKDIYQLPPSSSLTLQNQEVFINKYWNPLEDVRPLKLDSDKEYEVAFNEVFNEAVRCRLRSTKEVGVMLSGGLDSGAVACVAAKQLFEKDKQLKAFSSIPMTGYKDYLPKDSIADESQYIQSIIDMYNNIDLSLCRSENKDSITDMELFIDILEQPYKIIENLFWYNQIISDASKSGCKVLLNGQVGNMTISYGYFMTHVLTLFKRGKILKIFKEIEGYCNLYNAPKYYVTKAVIKAVTPYSFRKFVKKKDYKNKDIFEMTPINSNLISKWNIESRLKEKGYFTYPIRYLDLKEMRKYAVDPIAFSQIAAVETKFTLAHGIVKRDPTSDKRVIEFCLSLPSEQFVREGKGRFLIRRAMEGILPDKIRLNYDKRGQQSADWIQRIQPQWEKIYAKLENMLEDDKISKYIDVNKLKDQLTSIGKVIDEKCAESVRMFLITLIFSKFINDYSK